MFVNILKRKPMIPSCRLLPGGPARNPEGTESRGGAGTGGELRVHGRARRRLTAAGVCLFALPLAACLSDGPVHPQGGSGDGEGVEVSLTLEVANLAKAALSRTGATGAVGGLSALRPVDSARVTVTGADMDTLAFGFRLAGGPQTLSMIDIPPGAERTFRTELYREGLRLYAGNATVELRTDRANTVNVVCMPDFSRITASIHIPLDFPKVVAGGELRLWHGQDTLTVAAVTNGELRVFRIEEVPGDREYGVSLALWEPSGDTIARAHRTGLMVPRGQNVALVLPLSLAYTQIALGMIVEDAVTTTLVLTLPGGKRTATTFGEAVFSEVHPEPSADEGGENGEWIEVFNRVADTLDVSGCQITRDAGTGTGMKFVLPAQTLIPPGRGLVVARSAAVPFAHVVSGSALNLVNTSARMEFSCAEVRLDTLRYANSGIDSLVVRTAAGKVATLRPSGLAGRHRAAAWCQSLPSATGGSGGSVTATPGVIHGGCGE